MSCVSRLVEENCHSVQSFHMRRDAYTSVHMLTDVAPNAYTWIPAPTNHIKDWTNIHLHCHLTQSYSASYLRWTFCFCGTVTDDDTVYFAWLQSIIQPLYNVFSTSASTSFQISPSPYRASIWNKNSVVRNVQPTGVSTTCAYLFSFVHVSPRLPFWGPEIICIHFLPHVHRTETTWAWQVYYRKQCFSFEWLSHMQKRGEVSQEQLSQEVMPDSEPDNEHM
jgi:hypothetical protein